MSTVDTATVAAGLKIPVVVLSCMANFASYMIAVLQHLDVVAEIQGAMGGTVASEFNGSDGSKAIKKPGEIKHEVGTTCMGSDPQESVLNQYCQSWDVKNLFVTDGGCFASNADKNPTLSIMAIAWRSCDYLAQELRKGNI